MNDLTQYLKSEIKDFLFTELSDSFLAGSNLEFLSGIPVPIKQEDLKDFTSGGLSTTKIADNMAVVIGADSGFKYSEYYVRYLKKLFDEKLSLVFCTKAEELLTNKLPRKALCYLRAAVLVDPKGLQSMYCYANGCRIWYQSLEGSDEIELITLLKSDAYAYFAAVTNNYPDFAPAWYFLAYAYLNAGSYKKARLAFKHYMANSEGQPEDDVQEVKDRMEELEDPVKIEEGRDLLLAGRTLEALTVLEPYAQSRFSNWWPLHFYLATAYEALGHNAEAIEGYTKVLGLNPSNYDAMISLSELYEKAGDEEKARKYSEKAKLVLKNREDIPEEQ